MFSILNLTGCNKQALARFLTAAVVSVLVFCQGCQSMEYVERFRKSTDPYQGSPYRIALTRWSRDARIYQGLDVRLMASATYKSAAFRQAYVDEYARAYHLNDTRKSKLMEDQRNAAASFHDVIIAAYVPQKEWDDFDKRDSIWKFSLVTDTGRRVMPIEIRNLKKTDVILEHFFPYVTPWKSVYLVRFPIRVDGTQEYVIDEQTDVIKLEITSVFGTAEMTWNRANISKN